MEVIVDRIEGNYVVVEMENKECVNILKTLIPDAKEGDVVDIVINKKQTSKREKHIKELIDDVFEK